MSMQHSPSTEKSVEQRSTTGGSPQCCPLCEQMLTTGRSLAPAWLIIGKCGRDVLTKAFETLAWLAVVAAGTWVWYHPWQCIALLLILLFALVVIRIIQAFDRK